MMVYLHTEKLEEFNAELKLTTSKLAENLTTLHSLHNSITAKWNATSSVAFHDTGQKVLHSYELLVADLQDMQKLTDVAANNYHHVISAEEALMEHIF